MTTKEQIIRLVEGLDETEAERLLRQLSSGNGAVNGARSNGREAIPEEPSELVQSALDTPVEQRTPWQKLLVDGWAEDLARAGTPEGEAIAEITRRTLERIASRPPIPADDPFWDFIGMVERRPGEPLTNVAENHDEYLADAYADLHEDESPS